MKKDKPDSPSLPVAPSAADSLKYAQDIANALAKHFGPPTNWAVYPDLHGVLMQIDNMSSGMVLSRTRSTIVAYPATRSDVDSNPNS